MITFRKSLSLLLAAGLSVSLLAGCGSPDSGTAEGPSATVEIVNKEGFPIVSEPLTLTMMAPDVGIQNWQDMKVMQEMEKLTGIQLKFANAPLDSFETKKNLVFASGEYPDILYAASLTQAEEITYGSQGILLPLEELLPEYAPNVQKILDEHPDIRKSITAPDGHIYSLPRIDLNAVWYRGPLWYNGDFLKALGVKKLPETTEELYTYLKRVKEEDPNGNGKADEIPLESVKIKDIRVWMLGAFGIYDEELYVDDKEQVHFTPLDDAYLEYLKYMNRLWSEDLLDHEAFSQTDEQKKAKGRSNLLALFPDWHAYFTLGGEQSTEDPMFIPIKSDSVEAAAIAKHRGISTGQFAITSSNPAPEASLRWIDYIYTYEGALLFDKGPEGVLWKYTDKDILTKEWLPVPGGGDREEYRATLTPNYGIASPMMVNDDVVKGLKSDFDDWVDKETKEKLVDRGARVPFPALFLTQEEQTEVSGLLSDLRTYVEQMEARFVTGQEPLGNWNNYIETLEKMGGSRVREVYQGAYDRWKES
ncbi:extracellular solute-binding protein [Paenibacillus sp. P96]|uniref:Extracellular solute-binding protein n=1 Tax=Paenibacillus zeirhizosphaerae TaxID=2987519 RepID=A0ABT9FUB6_9BACL|nr:extracellular solute-binding protein [Paenibacillus sp. P96]MDP4098329.1 extracellular solute-binding protein [Paenibacillus sp. P96]